MRAKNSKSFSCSEKRSRQTLRQGCNVKSATRFPGSANLSQLRGNGRVVVQLSQIVSCRNRRQGSGCVSLSGEKVVCALLSRNMKPNIVAQSIQQIASVQNSLFDFL
ncbi:Hypothetical protein SMAX5B_017334 [Scophthalmus maximus]|uniref:Uncharacterized protein n=1 Tax=Scophthalmus maximus TaxID=52904 RepID=A0A2U9CPK2_SCOMX|nr:Hypothetical protein SMAX5B_017334 [Scophthalmus maximus]